MLIKINSLFHFCGERGIRTHDTISHGIHTFQACAFDHSAISPNAPKGAYKTVGKIQKKSNANDGGLFFYLLAFIWQSGDGKRLVPATVSFIIWCVFYLPYYNGLIILTEILNIKDYEFSNRQRPRWF